MKYCHNCKKQVNTRKVSAHMGIAIVTSYYCEECNNFIESEVKEIK